MKKIVFLIALFIYQISYTQSFSDSNITNDIIQKVDKYIVEKYDLKGDYITIYFNGSDCEKCSYPIYTFLDSEKAREIKKINVFTDTPVLAKKALEDYHNHTITYALDKKIPEMDPDIYNRTFYYIKKFTESENNTKDNILIKNDSIFTNDNIEVTRLPYEKILVYDNRIEKAVLLKEGVADQKPVYYDYIVKDTLKLYNLPERVVNKNLQKAEIKEYQKLRQKFKYKLLKIRSFSYSQFDKKVYCNFCLERIFKDKTEESAPINLITNCFIASLKIKTEKDLQKIFNIEDYDNYFLADLIMKDNEMYPISTFIYDQLEFTAPDTFNIKIKKFKPEMNDMEFQGLAKIKIEKNNLNIVSIDKNVDKHHRNNAILNFNGKPYLLLKSYSDEIANIGTIGFQKIIQQNHN